MNLPPMTQRIALFCVAMMLVLAALLRYQTDVAVKLLQLTALPTNALLSDAPWAGFPWPWTLVTYAWVQASARHLVWELLFFVVLGMQQERQWGQRSFLRFCFWAALGGGVGAVLVGLVVPPMRGVFSGLHAVNMALLVAFALANWQRELLFFGVLPIAGRYLLALYVFFDFLFWLTGESQNLPLTLGGAAAGYLLVTGMWRPSRWRRVGPAKRSTGHLRVVRNAEPKKRDDDEWLN